MAQEEVFRQETAVDRVRFLVTPSQLTGRPHACILGEELLVRTTEPLVPAKDCSAGMGGLMQEWVASCRNGWVASRKQLGIRRCLVIGCWLVSNIQPSARQC
jgi:hypothetical protein